MAVLKFIITGQTLQPETPKVIVGDTINYIDAQCVFSSAWDGLNKWLHFSKDGTTYDFQLTDDKCSGINLSAGEYTVYVHGSSETERITTNVRRIVVVATGTLDGEVLPEIEPSAAEQIAANAQAARETAEAAKAECDTVVTAADAAVTAASEATAAAKTATAEAQEAIESAERSAEEAAGSASGAEAAKTAAESAKTSAEASKTAAAVSETNAASSAAAAATSAASAKTNATYANDSATAAAQSAKNAGTHETNAESYAKQASASATAAAGSAAAAGTAKTGAETAQSAAEAAKTGAESAKSAAETAQGKAEASETNAAGSATAAAASAKSIEESATQIATNTTDIAELKEDIALKADKTALAETDRNLNYLWKLNEGISYQFETDSDEAYEKTVPTGAKVASVQSIGGKSGVWNQLNANDRDSAEANGITFVNNGDGTWTANGTQTGGTAQYATSSNTFDVVSNHIYWVGSITYDAATSTPRYRIYIDGSSVAYIAANVNIWTASASGAATLRLNFVNGAVATDVIFRPFFVDLTQMFGVTTTDAVTDEMKAWCESYAALHPEYNAGEIVSADVDAVNIASASGVQTASLEVPSSVRALDGYGWSAGSVYNEVDYENKKYVQRVAAVDLGTLSWNKGTYAFYHTMSGCNGSFLTSKYTTQADGTSGSVMGDKCVSWQPSSNRIFIKDSDYSDADTFKVAMSGVMLYYELATPIETDISSLLADSDIINPVEVEAGGTVTVHNDNLLETPNTEEYLISLAEVG